MFRGDFSPVTSSRLPAAMRRALAKGHGEGRHWSGGGARVDVFDAKGDALALLAALGVPAGRGADRARRPGLPASRPLRRRCNSVRRPWSAGSASCIPSACEALDVEGPLVALRDRARCRFRRPRRGRPRPSRSSSRSEFMPVARDLAFVDDRSDAAPADIVKAALGADRALIADARRVRRLSRARRAGGQQVGGGRRSRCSRASARLTDAEIEGGRSPRLSRKWPRRPEQRCRA